MAGVSVAARPRDIAAPATKPTRTPITAGWVIAAFLVAATIAFLHYYGISARDLAAFGLYTVLALAVPGALIWRSLLGRAHHIAVDLAGGTALATAIEIPAYLLCRVVGAPLAVIAWPLLTFVSFAAVPRLRRFWRGSGERLSIGATVSFAVLWGYFLVVPTMGAFRISGDSGRMARSPYVDIPFHLALTGELKNHFPAQIPYVTDTPLNYHWYVYAHIASASWITGIDPLVLIQRLIGLPVVAAFGVLIVAIARSLTGRYWPGVLAAVMCSIGLAAAPLSWTGATLAVGSLENVWDSPTMASGAMLFAALMFVLVARLRNTDTGASRGVWIAAILLSGAVAGSKSTFLPMLVCGAIFAIAATLLTTRRFGPAAWILAIAAGWMAFAQFIVFGGGTEGMVVAPLITVKRTALGSAVFGPNAPPNHYPALIVLVLAILVGWGCAWAAGIGLATRETRRDPTIWLIAGVGLAGMGAVFAFGHVSLSQVYFGISGIPYIAIAVMVGLAALIDLRERRREKIALLAGAGLIGIAAIYAVRLTVGDNPPHAPHTAWKTALPYAVLVLVLAVLAAGIWMLARSRRLDRRAATAAIAVMTMFTVVIPTIVPVIENYPVSHLRNVVAAKATIPAGGQAAMYWLRDHSRPNDVLATNEHCRAQATDCDARTFWISGLSERRVLIEGWAYTEESQAETTPYTNSNGGPFWEPALLATNDAVFTAPTAASVSDFAALYHVRWLVAVGPNVSRALGSIATLAYQASGVSIYRIGP